jgi:type VI secretion system protein ImpM
VSDTTALIPGWYGKIPTLGDFVSRRLPHHFVSAWDAWLQAAMTASREELGENWLDVYLTSPIWRFALMPGACTPEAWAGVLLPSVDKVGRYFPLTFALQLDPRTAVFSADPWYSALEEVAFSTLSTDCSAEDVEHGLANLAVPAALPHDAGAQSLATWWYSEPDPMSSIEIMLNGSIPSLITQTAQRAWVAAGYGRSMWWAASEQTGGKRLHCFLGLPPAIEFTSFMRAACSSEVITV